MRPLKQRLQCPSHVGNGDAEIGGLVAVHMDIQLGFVEVQIALGIHHERRGVHAIEYERHGALISGYCRTESRVADNKPNNTGTSVMMVAKTGGGGWTVQKVSWSNLVMCGSGDVVDCEISDHQIDTSPNRHITRSADSPHLAATAVPSLIL
jgi:hypothetical protein